MDDKTTTFDLPELLKGNVEAITGKLPEMTDDELAALAGLEKKGDKRVTLQREIEQEQACRKRIADALETRDAEVAKDIAATESAHAKALKAKDTTITDLTEQLRGEQFRRTAAEAAVAGPAQTMSLRVADAIELDPDAEAPALYALTEATQVVLADENGVSFRDLPPLEFHPDAYEPSGDRVKLVKDIVIEPGIPETGICKAFLMAGDKAVGVADLVSRFPGGGGRTAKISAGTFLFTGARSTTKSAA
ncbi:hypothetical protein [Stakelama pacifica]|uniref:Uncharacterized protein n=1 Tax=Stakelama pacifica TaxID=517720 RepID=A0A4R6FN00_9SPHN|nr:hypothetical protein [Stakelama pacifica]TDN82981.1 hypothetical protein EV664_105179 [Stakelama pacifica]GGO95012.1 hypothetical protein GCM10011329_18190 [Stakelama pacifica]